MDIILEIIYWVLPKSYPYKFKKVDQAYLITYLPSQFPTEITVIFTEKKVSYSTESENRNHKEAWDFGKFQSE